MGGPTQPTRAAKRFRVIVVLGAAALWISVFQPWCRIWGTTYTFLDVDDWKVLPIAELVIAAASALTVIVHLAWTKRIGLFLGASALALNAVGVITGARLANVHSSDPYLRIWAATSVVPERGLWMALLASAIVIAGALSSWPASMSVRGAPRESGTSLDYVSTGGDALHGIPKQLHASDDF